MATLVVTIARYIDDHPPGFVECVLADAENRLHRFHEKAPVVSDANLKPDTPYPQTGYIACIVEDEWVDAQGRTLVRVSTAQPWGIESVTGEARFTVLRTRIGAA